MTFFQVHEWKYLYFDPNFTEICSKRSSRRQISIMSCNRLAPNRRQAIIWTNADPAHIQPGLHHWQRSSYYDPGAVLKNLCRTAENIWRNANRVVNYQDEMCTYGVLHVYYVPMPFLHLELDMLRDLARPHPFWTSHTIPAHWLLENLRRKRVYLFSKHCACWRPSTVGC